MARTYYTPDNAPKMGVNKLSPEGEANAKKTVIKMDNKANQKSKNKPDGLMKAVSRVILGEKTTKNMNKRKDILDKI